MLRHVAILRIPARRFLADRSGATAIEYGLLIALVALAIVAGLGNTRDGVSGMFNYVMERAALALGTP